MKKITTIIGTRPEITKTAAVIEELDKKFKNILIYTGQHYDYNMSSVFFEQIRLRKPDYDLKIGSSTHAQQTAKAMIEIENVLLKEKPSLVIVEGDTNTTLAGALAARKLNIPLAHIEAGCRSFNKEMPEEINRIVADHSSSILFVPDEVALNNLKKEGFSDNLYLVGSTVFDTCKRNELLAKQSSILKRLNLNEKQYVVLTIHRAENTDNLKNLKEIIKAVNKISEKTKVVFPIHPRSKNLIEKYKIKLNKNILTLEPLSPLEFINLLSNCKVVITDSGGIHEEALYYNIPLIVTRDVTEWSRIIDMGKGFLGSNKSKNLIQTYNYVIDNYEKIINTPVKYDLGAVKRIVDIIKRCI